MPIRVAKTRYYPIVAITAKPQVFFFDSSCLTIAYRYNPFSICMGLMSEIASAVSSFRCKQSDGNITLSFEVQPLLCFKNFLLNTDTITISNYRIITYHAFHRKASFFSRLLSTHHHHRHCNSLRIHASLIRIVLLSLLHHFLSVATYLYLPKLT